MIVCEKAPRLPGRQACAADQKATQYVYTTEPEFYSLCDSCLAHLEEYEVNNYHEDDDNWNLVYSRNIVRDEYERGYCDQASYRHLMRLRDGS